jgi:hypothetical protein
VRIAANLDLFSFALAAEEIASIDSMGRN